MDGDGLNSALAVTAPNRSVVIITSGPVNANLKAPSSPLLQVIKQSVFNLITLPFRKIVQQQQQLRVLLMALVVVNYGRIPQQGSSMCTYKKNVRWESGQANKMNWICVKSEQGFIKRNSFFFSFCCCCLQLVAFHWMAAIIIILSHGRLICRLNSTQIRWSDRHENLLIAIIKLWELDQQQQQ